MRNGGLETKALEVVNCYKYLGLNFSTKLSLTQTVSELATKAIKAKHDQYTYSGVSGDWDMEIERCSLKSTMLRFFL